MGKRYRRLTPEKRREIMRLAGRGATQQEIAAAVDLSLDSVRVVVVSLGGGRHQSTPPPRMRRLSLDERVRSGWDLSRACRCGP